MIKKTSSLYVHVPFCKSICAYCDFTRSKCNDDLIEKWLFALKEEISQKDINRNLKTIYIGGGTPTSLNTNQLSQLLEMIQPYSSVVEEYTIEVNPETMDLEKLQILKKFGINRISMGLQAVQSNLLKLMNRKHTLDDVKLWVNHFKENGITNISLDLLYSLPTQSMIDLEESIDEVIKLNINHISIYSLTIEPGSEFKRLNYTSLSEDEEASIYFKAVSKLNEAGIIQYEISNFARLGYESKHNLAYWHYDDFYGIGMGASGKENHCRYDNTNNFNHYFNHIEPEIIHLSKKDEMFEMIMMNLRLVRGMKIIDFNEKFNEDFKDIYAYAIISCINKGWLEMDDGFVRCTELGYPILNTVLEEFMEE